MRRAPACSTRCCCCACRSTSPVRVVCLLFVVAVCCLLLLRLMLARLQTARASDSASKWNAASCLRRSTAVGSVCARACRSRSLTRAPQCSAARRQRAPKRCCAPRAARATCRWSRWLRHSPTATRGSTLARCDAARSMSLLLIARAALQRSRSRITLRRTRPHCSASTTAPSARRPPRSTRRSTC